MILAHCSDTWAAAERDATVDFGTEPPTGLGVQADVLALTATLTQPKTIMWTENGARAGLQGRKAAGPYSQHVTSKPNQQAAIEWDIADRHYQLRPTGSLLPCAAGK